MSNDAAIARNVKLKPIEEIAARLGIGPESLEKYGIYKAKLIPDKILRTESRRGKLVMVTAMTPTPAGEGKTTTAIGLADALSLMGKKAAVALREPSLGPVFGMKGGATGGGYAQVAPRDEINLHFTGDLHAVSAAHNLLAAMVDNRLHYDGPCGMLDGGSVTWKRVVDMDDRALRDVVVGLGISMQGMARETGYDITAASEVMAVLCLSMDLKELKARLGNICVGYSPEGTPLFARDVKAAGAMAALLKDALKPNLVQTLEGTPAFIHGGPFANIAHGASSVVATSIALDLAEVVITETGFASDLGAEKFFDIVVRTGHVPPPDACVLVATLRALKYHGGVKLDAVKEENAGAVAKGFENLLKHAENIRTFGVPFVVALNKFPGDAEADVKTFLDLCAHEGVRAALSDVYGQGGRGGLGLARELVAAIEKDKHEFRFLYPLDIPLEAKIAAIAKAIYGADGVVMESKSRKKLLKLEKDGFGGLPVCVAKTQNSLSDDPEALGRPRGFEVVVTDVALRAGAGFVVALCGEIMTMPGLPKAPAAERVDVTDDGEIVGLS